MNVTMAVALVVACAESTPGMTERALELSRAGQHDQAIALALEARAAASPAEQHDADATLAIAFARKADALQAAGDLAGAEAMYRRVVETWPDSDAAETALDEIDGLRCIGGTWGYARPGRTPPFMHLSATPKACADGLKIHSFTMSDAKGPCECRLPPWSATEATRAPGGAPAVHLDAGPPSVFRNSSDLKPLVAVLRSSRDELCPEVNAALSKAADEFARREIESTIGAACDARREQARQQALSQQALLRFRGFAGEYDFDARAWPFQPLDVTWTADSVVMGARGYAAETGAVADGDGVRGWSHVQHDIEPGPGGVRWNPKVVALIPMTEAEAAARRDEVRALNELQVLVRPTNSTVELARVPELPDRLVGVDVLSWRICTEAGNRCTTWVGRGLTRTPTLQ